MYVHMYIRLFYMVEITFKEGPPVLSEEQGKRRQQKLKGASRDELAPISYLLIT